MLVLQQKRLKSLNLNQTLDMAPPLPFFATVRQVMQARCWVSRLSPSMYALFVCLGQIGFLRIMGVFMNKIDPYAWNGAVWDLSTCLRHMDILFGKRNSDVTARCHNLSLYFSGMSAQEMLCWGSLCLPAEDARPGIYPDV